MKINFTFIKKLLLDYKYLILGMLLIIIFFSFPVSVSREGLDTSNCDYKYLDPPSKSKDGWDYWNENTKRQFITKYLEYKKKVGGTIPSISEKITNELIAGSTNDPYYAVFLKQLKTIHIGEAVYFFNYGFFFRPQYFLDKIRPLLLGLLKSRPSSFPSELKSDIAIEKINSEGFSKLSGVLGLGITLPNIPFMEIYIKQVFSGYNDDPEKIALSIIKGTAPQLCYSQAEELSLLSPVYLITSSTPLPLPTPPLPLPTPPLPLPTPPLLPTPPPLPTPSLPTSSLPTSSLPSPSLLTSSLPTPLAVSELSSVIYTNPAPLAATSTLAMNDLSSITDNTCQQIVSLCKITASSNEKRTYQPPTSTLAAYQPPTSTLAAYQPPTSTLAAYQPPTSILAAYQPPTSTLAAYQPPTSILAAYQAPIVPVNNASKGQSSAPEN